ncbi:carboxy terminal-processing peptidase [Flocculibacter collagenilyticus]|uniref:carboxy terminal-processing peptidase n=1 Tax=Flocculibacter collagenilyticus TaxID=2744479 RepID=UPI0018F4DB4D|nr:carboxy terminal-processing peptidase [Flocculibacter collagenilyticus]
MGKVLSCLIGAVSVVTLPSFAVKVNSTVSINELPVLSQEQQHTAAIKRLTQHFTRNHYIEVELSDTLSEKIYHRYLKSLDSNKSYFLADDVKKFDHLEKSFDDAIEKRKLEDAYSIFNLNMKRRFQRFEYALSLLDKEMKFDVKDEYFYDREDADWAANEAELNEIWRQKVKFDALSLKLTGKDWSEIKDVLTKRYNNAIKRLSQSQSEDAFQIIMNAYARSIEAHTSYLSPRNADRFRMEMNLSLEGIGAVLQSDEDYTVIRSLVPGGPADKTEQLKPKDKIIGVAQGDEEFVDIIGWRLDDVVELIKGPKGTSVKLQIISGEKASSDSTKEVVIVRDKIKLEDRAAKSEVFEPTYSKIDAKLGVITIPSFYNNLARDVRLEIDKLLKEKVDGIVIDLRDNGGGSLEEATRLTGLFIDKGPVVQIRSGRGNVNVKKDHDGRTFYDGPLTVLVNRYSASASEIFAAALQDYGRAIVIGEQTFGKGTVQQHRGLSRVFDLYDNKLGSVQYTMAKFYRINGGSTQHKGVIPDIQFPSAIDPSEWGESQEENALPWDSIGKAGYIAQGEMNQLVNKLEQAHQQRIKSEPEFKYLANDIERYKTEKDKKSISLVEAERKAKREDNEKTNLVRANERLERLGLEKVKSLDDLPKEVEEIDPFLEEAANITADLIMYDKLAKK